MSRRCWKVSGGGDDDKEGLNGGGVTDSILALTVTVARELGCGS